MISKPALALAFCVSLLLLGCGKPNPMLGIWKMQPGAKSKEAGAIPPESTLEFKADGTFTANISGAGKTSTAEGTYALQGNQLTMTLTKQDGAEPKDKTPTHVTISEEGKSFEFPNSPGLGKMVKQ